MVQKKVLGDGGLGNFLNSCVGGDRRVSAKELFGVELECEGKNIRDATDKVLRSWVPHHDGSLRGNHGDAIEWVFANPLTYAQSCKAIADLFTNFTANKAKLVTSNRTSTHVHYNMLQHPNYQVVNAFILFTLLEDILDSYCGEDRKGNLFCLSSRHAEEQVSLMEDSCLIYQNFREFSNDKRYSSLNINAINKFGSLEFRAMRGLDNPEELVEWVTIVRELMNYACFEMGNPVDTIQRLSMEGPEELVKKVFSADLACKLTEGWTGEQIRQSVFTGLRLIQPLAYHVGNVWGEVEEVKKDFWEKKAEELNIEPVGELKRVDRGPIHDVLRPNIVVMRDIDIRPNHHIQLRDF